MLNFEEITTVWTGLAEQIVAGAGSITCKNGETRNGQLRLWQLLNGCLAIELVTDTLLKCKSCGHFQGKLLQGDRVVDDQHIEVTGIQLNHTVTLDFEKWFHLGTADQWATIYDIHKPRPECRKVVCGLTNLYLEMDHSLTFDLDGLHVELSRRTGAAQTYIKGRALNGPAVLGELRVTSDVPLPDSKWNEFIGELCFLLSLAHRNRVAKAFKLRYGDEDQPCSQEFYGLGAESARVAKRPLIATEDLTEYLRQTFPQVSKVYNPWQLGVAVDHYFRAMDSTSAWPMGVGIVVALECLVSAFAGREGVEYYFSNEMEEFDPLLKQLADTVLSFLNSHFPERVGQLKASSAELQSWRMGLRSLNRRSFKQKMHSMLGALHVEASGAVLQRFVNIRNDLVHYGYPTSQDWSPEFQKIMQMAELLDRVFLAVLGYKGPIRKLGISSSES